MDIFFFCHCGVIEIDNLFVFNNWYDFICTKSQPKGRITVYNMREENTHTHTHTLSRNKDISTTIDNREIKPN